MIYNILANILQVLITLLQKTVQQSNIRQGTPAEVRRNSRGKFRRTPGGPILTFYLFGPKLRDCCSKINFSSF